jgi:hypothetical protein
MVRYYATFLQDKSSAGISLGKYQSQYKARVDSDGQMVISKSTEGAEFVDIASKASEPIALGKPIAIKFANVDHQVIFEVGGESLVFDLGRGPNDAGPITKKIEPQVKIFGSGKLELCHIALYRDIHYTDTDGPGPGRGGQGNAFKLAKDEFFVLGDNSPNSADSRWWGQPGRGNNGMIYREGIVPRDYLVGKALFVYWPSGFRPYPGFPVPVIPDIGHMRIIYSGK